MKTETESATLRLLFGKNIYYKWKFHMKKCLNDLFNTFNFVEFSKGHIIWV